ncbi:MAG: A/G-specific adenine glycosylase [Bdellovibrionaceae bacterium]|nr:A/G-specific adenine glycosylase [Pseudobdellovibrionaceae bacterium]
MKQKRPKTTDFYAPLAQDLVEWYERGHRDLPWRKTKDPYAIWISEIMLQQTTSTAVIPFYKKFLARFPTLVSLSKASQDDVYALWAGLGYYSRARNILKAAKELSQKEFPRVWSELIEHPGFGPYTARAVTSFAFGERVGVVDGNVIRCLSRLFDLEDPWWSTRGRETFQEKADALAIANNSATVNQALMELGATICTPKSPTCALCPWSKSCLALKRKTIDMRPLQKPRPTMEVFLWTPEIRIQKNKVAMVDNTYAPFLKNSKIFPGSLKKLKTPPKNYDFKHAITRYQIYTKVDIQKKISHSASQMFELAEFSKLFPYSLYKKALDHARKNK